MAGAVEGAHAAIARLIAASDNLQGAFSSRHNLIPHMAWEQQVEDVLALSKDQMRFTLALFASVPVGAGIRLFKNPTVRHIYSLLSGLLLTYYPFGAGVAHAVPHTLLTYLVMALFPRRCGTLAWAINFPYLIYLHIVNASGQNWMQGVMDFTGCDMVLVLKLISVAVCYQDHWVKKKEELTAYQASHALAALPNPLEFISYVFSLGNLLAGPYLEFADYKQFIEHEGVWDPKAAKVAPSVVLPSLRCVGEAALFMALYLKSVPVWNVDTFRSQWYKSAPLLTRFGAIFLAGITNQWKYCFAWKLSETSLTLAGINFAGWDEATGKAQWGRYINVRYLELITCDSARMVPQYWNVGTGRFLRRYVYERLVPRGRKPGFPQLLATQMTSAVWHGLYAGYQLFFAGSAVWIFFSTLLWKAEEKFAPRLSKTLPWKVLKVGWTNFVLNYMATAFMVLDLKESLGVYSSVYYAPHLIMLAGCLIGPGIVGGKRGKSASSTKKEPQPQPAVGKPTDKTE